MEPGGSGGLSRPMNSCSTEYYVQRWICAVLLIAFFGIKTFMNVNEPLHVPFPSVGFELNIFAWFSCSIFLLPCITGFFTVNNSNRVSKCVWILKFQSICSSWPVDNLGHTTWRYQWSSQLLVCSPHALKNFPLHYTTKAVLLCLASLRCSLSRLVMEKEYSK